MKIKSFLVYLCLLLISSCVSVKKYNEHIQHEIKPDKLKKDVDYVHKKLNKDHPKLDLYIPQDKIDFKFDSLKKTINQPLTPNQFYLKIQPILAELKHGHTDIFPLFEKLSKQERKRLKDSKGPFSQITTSWDNNSLYISATTVKDSLLKTGTKILKIDSLSPIQLKEKYKTALFGDGNNKTYFENRLNRTFFNYFYTLENGVKDSILLTVSNQENINQVYLKREFKKIAEKTQKSIKKDSIKLQKQVVKKKDEKLKSFNFSYNKSTKLYARTLSFPTNDSAFAVLKIATFSYGKYDEDYKEIFKLIEDYKVRNLVLDLRNNGGGRLADANTLFSYLKPKQEDFVEEQIVKSRGSLQRTIVGIIPQVGKPIIYPFSYISYVITAKNKDGSYKIKPRISRIKNNNPKNDYKGNLYVLINGGSYSASVMISANLKGLNRAYFVGEETGGDANGTVAGLMPNYKLPNSKLLLSIGTIYLTPKYYSDSAIGRGIFPDQEVKETLKDRINRSDSQLKWILKDIKEDNKALKEQLNYLPE